MSMDTGLGLRDRLRSVRSRFAARALGHGLERLVRIVVPAAAAVALGDLLFRWSGQGRWFFFCCLVGGAFALGRRRLWGPWRRVLGMTEAEVAESIEARLPELRDRLLGVLADPEEASGESEELASRFREEAIRQSGSWDAQRLFGSGGGKVWMRAGLWVALFLTAGLIWPRFAVALERLVPWRERPWVSWRLDQAEFRVAQGGAVKVAARAGGYPPAQAELVIEPLGPEQGSSVEASTPPVVAALGSGRFEAEIPQMERSSRFYFRAGESKSPIGRVIVLKRPVVETIEVTVNHPAYTGRGSETHASGDLSVVEGAQVRWRLRWSKPIRSARLTMEGGAVHPMTVSGSEAELGLAVVAGGTYSVEARDIDELEMVEPLRYRLRVLPDKAPRIDLRHPSRAEVKVAPQAVIPFRMEVDDDYGVQGASFVIASEEGEEFYRATIGSPEAFGPRRSEVSLVYPWTLSDKDFDEVGSRYDVCVEATDFRPEPNVGRGGRVQVRIVPVEEKIADLDERTGTLRKMIEEAGEKQFLAAKTTAEAADRGADAVVINRIRSLQRTVADRLEKASGMVEEIVGEIGYNGLEGSYASLAVLSDVREALVQLSKESVPPVLATLDRLREELGRLQTAKLLLETDVGQERLGLDIAAVLKLLAGWEDYGALIRMTRQIHGVHGEVTKTLRKEVGKPEEETGEPRYR
jgi:hypothetical protein